ncbi:hypothetical protein [Actinacidiphila reveromycinica]|uniref:hypothetical protein n=1 Tax=Actinacidiphila reveromycinica TaxID=659352 RepID=UPI001922FA7E|nr:hypothetical protein [Streptomyces sp. SN-593]
MTGLSEARRRALLAAAADPDGLLPKGVNQRTAIALEGLGYIERWPLLLGGPVDDARSMGVTGAAAVILAGRAYTDLARTVWPTAETPLAGVGGMGKQKQLLARIAAAV